MHTPDTELHRATGTYILQNRTIKIRRYILQKQNCVKNRRNTPQIQNYRESGTYFSYKLYKAVDTYSRYRNYRTTGTYLLQIQNYRVAGTTPDTELYIDPLILTLDTELQRRRYIL
jgi:hypothetical protein